MDYTLKGKKNIEKFLKKYPNWKYTTYEDNINFISDILKAQPNKHESFKNLLICIGVDKNKLINVKFNAFTNPCPDCKTEMVFGNYCPTCQEDKIIPLSLNSKYRCEKCRELISQKQCPECNHYHREDLLAGAHREQIANPDERILFNEQMLLVNPNNWGPPDNNNKTFTLYNFLFNKKRDLDTFIQNSLNNLIKEYNTTKNHKVFIKKRNKLRKEIILKLIKTSYHKIPKNNVNEYINDFLTYAGIQNQSNDFRQKIINEIENK